MGLEGIINNNYKYLLIFIIFLASSCTSIKERKKNNTPQIYPGLSVYLSKKNKPNNDPKHKNQNKPKLNRGQAPLLIPTIPAWFLEITENFIFDTMLLPYDVYKISKRKNFSKT